MKHKKEEWLKAAEFADRRDALAVILKDGEEVTRQEVKKRLYTFLKEQVN